MFRCFRRAIFVVIYILALDIYRSIFLRTNSHEIAEVCNRHQRDIRISFLREL